MISPRRNFTLESARRELSYLSGGREVVDVTLIQFCRQDKRFAEFPAMIA